MRRVCKHVGWTWLVGSARATTAAAVHFRGRCRGGQRSRKGVADGQHSEAIGAAARQRRVRGVRNIQKQISKIRKNTAIMWGEGEVRWGGGGKGPGSSPGSGRDWLSVFRARGDRRSKPAAAPRRPRIRTAGRLKTAAPSSPTLGKAGADSQWSSREETNSVSSRRRRWRSSQRARRRALAPHPRPHPLAKPAAPALRRPSSASPARLRPFAMTENLEKESVSHIKGCL